METPNAKKPKFESLTSTLIKGFFIPAVLITTAACSMTAYINIVYARIPLVVTLGMLLPVFVFAITAAILASIYVARIITRPIVALRDVAVKFGKGELKTRVHFDFNNEIAQLGDDFSVMAQAVETRTRQIEEERAKLLASINSLSLGFALVNRSHEIVVANRKMGEMFALEYVDLAEVARLLGDAPAFFAAANECLKGKKLVEIPEVAFQDVFFSISFTPVFSSSDKSPLGYVALFTDVTERKLLDSAKDEFVAIASHEMRTPLTIIRGNAELILGQKTVRKDEKFVQMMKSIEDNSARMMDIVNDFLDLTQLENGKLTFSKDTIELPAFMSAVTEDFKNSFTEKGLALTLREPSFPASGIADKERLRQVFVNLLANALHHTERGGVTVSFEDGKDFIKVLIADTGLGMDPLQRAGLFKKFQAVGKSFVRTREYGSGLGLYIGKLLMESMGGSIALESSEVGKGSVFSVCVPKSPAAGV